MKAVQARYQAVAQEFNRLQLLLNVEAGKPENNPAAGTAEAAANANAITVGASTSGRAAPPLATDINKTDMVRELLRQHPAGITPTDLWKQVKTRMTHRAYLYSILKRLKDKDEVMVRRGKYIAKMVPKPEEGKEQPILH